MDNQDREQQKNFQEDMDEDIESVSHFSFRSVTRSESDGSYSARLSPRAIDPDEEEDIDIESQCFFDAKATNEEKQSLMDTSASQPFLFEFHDVAPWNTAFKDANTEVPTSLKNKEQDTNPGMSINPRTPRWWEARADGSPGPRWWEQAAAWSENSGRSRHSIFSFATPPPPQPPQRSNERRFGLPGAFSIPGINARLNSNGEEEKEEEASHYSAYDGSDSLEDEMEDILLLEATLVSEKSSIKDSEIPTNELVQAEPLKSRCTPPFICAMIILLTFIAVVAAAAGTEWGRRRYDVDVPSTKTLSPTTLSAATTSRPGTDISLDNSTETSSEPPPMKLPGSTPQQGNVQVDTLEPVMPAPPHSQTNSSYMSSMSMSNASENVESASDFVLNLLPDKTKVSLDDPMSPQSMAFKWLMEDPMLEKYPAGRIIQRFALATLFFSTDGQNWERKDHHWLSYDQDEDECSWWTDAPSGLLCQDGYYKILSMNQLVLNGTLPEEIWLLSTLVSLQLFDHDISGSMPTRIGKMPHLESLWLHDLSLEGTIPSEIGLGKLKSLILGGNMLEGPIPAEIGKSEQLQQLFLDENDLTGTVPASIFALTDLEDLVLNNNSLTGTLPDSIGGLTALKFAHLAFNSFSGTLPDFNSLTELRALVLQANDFTGVIPDLSGLEHLEYLFLGQNALEGALPTQLFSLTTLMVLDLRQNRLQKSIPSEIGDLAALEVLDFFDNSFTGTLPSSLGQLSNAQKIMLENNRLEGTIPSSLGLLTGLERLWLHDNNLSGSVPIEICDLIDMNALDVSVDCFKVSCDCGCDCERSTPPVINGDRNEETNTSAWDEFVAFFENLFS